MRYPKYAVLAVSLILTLVLNACSIPGAAVRAGAQENRSAQQNTGSSSSQVVLLAAGQKADNPQVKASPTAGPNGGPALRTPQAPGKNQGGKNQPTGPGSFTMVQTLSDNAQQTTIAFDGLAFLTGSLGSDSFFPPGKVADFWGFQYLRDNDLTEMGHNTDFLTRASLNMLTILNSDQKAQLLSLAKKQVSAINDYGYKRFVLMTAFRRLLAGDLPAGTSGLDEEKVKAFSAELYQLDGQMSLERAQVMGSILHNLDANQKSYLAKMVGKGMSTWPDVPEPDELRLTTHDEKVAVMTYAGDMFAWYAGSVDADVYFCPERQGTYFGSFYMKDAPAVGNPGYSIGTNITADMGKAFVEALTPQQAQLIAGLVDIQRPALTAIVDVRKQVSEELRKDLAGGSADVSAVQTLMEKIRRAGWFHCLQLCHPFCPGGPDPDQRSKDQIDGFTPPDSGRFSTQSGFPVRRAD